MQRTVLSLSLVFVVWSLAVPAFAQDDAPEMITDRPDVTESSQTVPRYHFQLEAGVFFGFDKVVANRIEVDQSNFDLLNMLLRIGLADWAELRLGTLYTFKTVEAVGESEETDGVNGLVIGTKLHLFGEKGIRPDAGLILDLALPVGREELTGKKANPGFIFAASHTLHEKIGFSYNLGGRWDAERNFIFKYSGSFGFGVAKSLGLFAEFFGNASDAFDSMVSVDGGIAWQYRPNFQLDISGGAALTEEGDDWFANAGLSFRLPR
jgi:hypothetical protein